MDKPLLKSKTIWASMLLVLFGCLQAAGIVLPYKAIYPTLIGFLGYGMRDAISKD